MDATVEDDHDRPIDRLAIDDAGEVGARRPDQEATRLEQQPRVAQEGIGGPAGGDPRQPGPEPDQVERLLVRLVRDPEPAAGVDQADGRPGRERQAARRAHGRRDVLDERARVEDVGRPERMQPEEVEVRRGDRAARPRARGRRRPSRTCPPRRRRPGGPARAGRARRRRPAAGPAGPGRGRPRCASSRASSPGDSTVTARIPAATAARSSSSRLPGPVITIRSGSIPARRTVASSPPEATSAPSPSRPRCSTTASAGLALTA